MTDTTLEKQLSDDLVKAKNDLKSLQAQQVACQQMLNESNQAGLNLRTNIILFQQALQEAGQNANNLTKERNDLVKERDALLDRITALDAELSTFKNSAPELKVVENGTN